MRGCLMWLAVNSLPLWLVCQFVPGISYQGNVLYLVLIGLLIGLINLPLLPYLYGFTASPAEAKRHGATVLSEHQMSPSAIFMVGLIYLAINSILLYFVAWLASRLDVGLSVHSLGGAILGGLAISASNWLMLAVHRKSEAREEQSPVKRMVEEEYGFRPAQRDKREVSKQDPGSVAAGSLGTGRHQRRAQRQLIEIRRALEASDLDSARALIKNLLSGESYAVIQRVAVFFFANCGHLNKARALVLTMLDEPELAADACYLNSRLVASDKERLRFLQIAVKKDPLHPQATRDLSAIEARVNEKLLKRYETLRAIFVWGFIIDCGKAFVPTRRIFVPFFGQTEWLSQVSSLRISERLGGGDALGYYAAIAAAAGFAILGISLPRRGVFLCGAIFSLFTLLWRWGMWSDPLIHYHPLYIFLSYAVILMQATGFLIVPPPTSDAKNRL